MNIVCHGFVAPKLQGQIACVGSTKTSSRTIDASSWFPFQVFSIEITVIGKSLSLGCVVCSLDEFFRWFDTALLGFMKSEETSCVDEGY